MAEVKLRLNLDAEEVELVVDGQVALSSGKDVLANWVQVLNEKNKPVHVEPVAPAAPVVAPVVEPPVAVAAPVPVTPAEPVQVTVPVNQNVIESPTVETTPAEPLVPATDA
jgi:hypothetical protein